MLLFFPSALAFSAIFPRTFASTNEHPTSNAAASQGSNVYSKEHFLGALRPALFTNCNLLGGAIFNGPSLDIISLTLLHAYFIRSPKDLDRVILSINGALHPGLIPNGSSKFLRQNVEYCVSGIKEWVIGLDVDGEASA